MSDKNNQTKNIEIKFELPQVANTALTPLATSIGTTLSNLWDGFTMGITTWHGKKKIESEHNLKLYAEEIQNELSKIPEENLQEPKMSIVGPSIDASKYYFEEEWYRSMFAKLISASCDNRKNDKIHPYFVEAIKQLTSLEASIIKGFKKNSKQAIARYRFVSKNNEGNYDWFPIVFFMDTNPVAPDYCASSISNLVRLGFLEMSFSRYLTNNNYYLRYENDPNYLSMKKMLQQSKENNNNKYKDVEVEKGIVILTPLGSNFLDICM